jgi:alkylhydroperoxidase family enzyme
MPYIRTIDPAAATGTLKAEYDAGIARAGRIWNLLPLMSLNPEVLAALMRLYEAALLGPSPLSRRQREMLAVVTSAINSCHY